MGIITSLLTVVVVYVVLLVVLGMTEKYRRQKVLEYWRNKKDNP